MTRLRTFFLLLASLTLAVALFGTYQGQAQEAPLDLGETNLLLLACDYVTALAKDEGLEVRYCRRYAPDEIVGYDARVVVKVSVPHVGRLLVGVNFKKSLWSVQAWDVTPAG